MLNGQMSPGHNVEVKLATSVSSSPLDVRVRVNLLKIYVHTRSSKTMQPHHSTEHTFTRLRDRDRILQESSRPRNVGPEAVICLLEKWPLPPSASPSVHFSFSYHNARGEFYYWINVKYGVPAVLIRSPWIIHRAIYKNAHARET